VKDILSDEIDAKGVFVVQVMVRYKVKRSELERELEMLRPVCEGPPVVAELGEVGSFGYAG
jgi:hypothetical protein